MPRKRQSPGDAGQMGFDFEFQETVDTIEALQADLIDTDDEVQSNDHNGKPTPGNRIEGTPGINDQGDPPVVLVQPARMEDPGSVGVEQPRATSGFGAGERDASVGSGAPAATDRAGGDHESASRRQSRPDGVRDPAAAGDRPGPVVLPVDYVIEAKDRIGAGGAKSKFKDNIAAIETLQTLRAEGRGATWEEQGRLVKYVGWGGLPQAFDPRSTPWQNEYRQLVDLLSPDEYEKARRSTQDAHYTSPAVISGVYQGLRRLGFTGGKVLEPAAGTGNFIGMMPDALRNESHFTAIELDPITAEIGKHLYPTARYINRGLQDVVIPNEYFDACVGNPPFGSQSLYDPDHRDLGNFSIHNYFLAKSIEKLKPGGVMAFVVSRYFLDANNSKAREHIADRADFLGAIRLPNTAFKENALTEVTTDIVFFQRSTGLRDSDRTWVGVGEVKDRETGAGITINQYFIDNPGQMAGTMVLSDNMHKGSADLIAEPGLDLEAAIAERLAVLPTNIFRVPDQDIPTEGEAKPELILPDTLKIGSYFVAPTGEIARRLPDELDKHDYQIVALKNERAGHRIRGMIEIRDALRALMKEEQQGDSPEPLRQALNAVYDRFVRKLGHISSQANRLAMGGDPEFPLLHALESNYDRGISADLARKQGVDQRAPSADKAAIFSRRVFSPRQEVIQVENAKDALVVSMNQVGRVDMDRMIRLSGLSEPQIIKDLAGLIYLNPRTESWETSDKYLSGNVKLKLSIAEVAAGLDPKFRPNVDALLAIQPPDIDPVDISVQLGSTWVPPEVVDDFVQHLLGDVQRRISYQESLGKWLVKVGRADNTTNTVTWGTESYPANELIEAILTNTSIQVKKEVGRDEHGKAIMRVDEVETAAAVQKADEIKQAFLDWIWEDQARRETLADLYNERFNTNVTAQYDGSHLALAGTSLDITLRPHQKDAIWRGIQEGTALFDHVVGAGKTLVCVGTVLESKRMGLCNKPMLVVPNHLLLQWKDAIYSLYPDANVLVAEKSDFKKENRERLFARIATGDWDAVVVAHSSFKRIGMPKDTLEQLLNEQIDDLTGAIAQMKSQQGDRVTIKEMEKARERMTERLEKKADTGRKDEAVDFADLGVDALVVDEAQEFKNLFITTSLSRISGLGNLTGSDKAFDLFVKCRYLQQKYEGRGVYLATGTPLSNTIAELYTVQRYMQYDTLKERGIVHFDAWASTFGQVVTGWELDATGVNYKLNSRFAKFQNVPELTAMYRSFADVITKKDLQDQAAARGTRFPVPLVKGGKPQNLIVERSAAQATYMGIQREVLDDRGQPVHRADGGVIRDWNAGSIIHRMENLPKDPRLDNPLKITNDARKAGLDYRLIDPEAGDHAGSKVNTCVANIMRIWSDWDDRKGTQLVFCDLSTPKGKSRSATPVQDDTPEKASDEEGDEEATVISMDEILAGSSAFSVYEDIRSKLIDRGVPPEQVRFIHDASTDLQKAKLFDEMNRGDVRILLGSTAKMGAGTNVQRRLVALHHLDAPWRPSDLEQREGRIERQGNLFYEMDPTGFEVEIIRYATKQTYDSRMWQTIEFKAAGIEQFRKGDSQMRVIEDVAGEAANAAEMKAAATGNPLIFLQVQLSSELKKVEALYASFKRNQHSLDKRYAWLQGADDRAVRAEQKWSKEIELRDASTLPGFSFVSSGKTYTDDNKDALSGSILYAMKQAVSRKTETTYQKPALVNVGQYRGFDIEVYCHRDQIQFSVTGYDSYEPGNLVYNTADKFSVPGFINRLDNFMATFEDNKLQASQTCEKEKSELEKVVQEKSKPFANATRLENLREDVRDVMKELKIMQGDPDYVSTWVPKSTMISETAKPKSSSTACR